jgi:LPS export ABC transporter protein LptC
VHISQPASTSPNGPRPATDIRSQKIKAFVKEERLVSEAPVEVRRGQDLFTAEKMQMNSKTGEYELNGKVRGLVQVAKP